MTESIEDQAADVRDLLARALEVDPPATRLRAHDVATAYRHRRALRRAALGAATVATSALLVVPLALTGDRGRAPDARPTMTAQQAADAAIVHDGDVVQAQGRVVAARGAATRFCVPVPVPDGRGGGPSISACSFGVDVTGVDLAELSMRREQAGTVEGFANLRGVYRHGTVEVTSQGKFRAVAPPRPAWTAPPCPTPSGGWPTLGSAIPGKAEIDAYDQAHPGDITNRVLFQPTPHTRVFVLAADHPDAVRQALGEDSSRYCVVKSRFSRTQIAAAWSAAGKELADGTTSGVWAATYRTDRDGQLSVSLGAVAMTPRLRDIVAAQPEGLVAVDAWLTRVRPATR